MSIVWVDLAGTRRALSKERNDAPFTQTSTPECLVQDRKKPEKAPPDVMLRRRGSPPDVMLRRRGGREFSGSEILDQALGSGGLSKRGIV